MTKRGSDRSFHPCLYASTYMHTRAGSSKQEWWLQTVRRPWPSRLRWTSKPIPSPPAFLDPRPFLDTLPRPLPGSTRRGHALGGDEALELALVQDLDLVRPTHPVVDGRRCTRTGTHAGRGRIPGTCGSKRHLCPGRGSKSPRTAARERGAQERGARIGCASAPHAPTVPMTTLEPKFHAAFSRSVLGVGNSPFCAGGGQCGHAGWGRGAGSPRSGPHASEAADSCRRHAPAPRGRRCRRCGAAGT